MAQSQVNGSNLTDNGFGSYTQANNRNGTIKANGTSPSNVLENVRTSTPVVNAFGSKVVEDSVTSKDYAGKSITGGVFAHEHQRPITSLVTTEIAGLASNAIKSTANDLANRSIHRVENHRSNLFTAAIRANKYNRVTGRFDSGFPALQTITPWNISGNTTGSGSTDEAANPTASVPGELTFRTGAKVPFNANYARKTNY